MFSNGRKAIMYDRRGVKCDTDIRNWNRCWQVMQSYCSGYVDPIGSLDIPMVRHKDESIYVLHLATLVEHAGTVRGLIGLLS